VIVPVFKTGGWHLAVSPMGSTPIRFRQSKIFVKGAALPPNCKSADIPHVLHTRESEMCFHCDGTPGKLASDFRISRFASLRAMKPGNARQNGSPQRVSSVAKFR
jgi:hypothetical protein